MDLILYNGKVYTQDDRIPTAEAIAIRQGRIAAVGTDSHILSLRSQKSHLIDLNGRVVVPGFNDSHVHLLSYGLSLSAVDLNPCRSILDVQSAGDRFIRECNPPLGRWIEGRGWNQNHFAEKRMLKKCDLDGISKDYPIMFKRTCGQITVVNSTALAIIQGSAAQEELDNLAGVEKDENHIPTGVFRGTAQELVYQVIPRLSVAEIKEGIIRALANYARSGLTSVQTDDFELKKAHYQDILRAYEELDQAGELPVRVNQMVCLPQAEDLEDLIRAGYRTGTGTPTFRIGPYTLQTDGSLGAKTAAVRGGYVDQPDNFGILYYDEEEFSKLMELAWSNGFQVAADGIGDRGIELALDTFRFLEEKHPKKDPRSCVDHCQITTPELLQKFADYQVIGGLEVIFVASDLHMVEERIGPRRARWSYNWKGFVDRKIPVAIGSDSPVEDHNPLLGIYAGVMRQDFSGYPPEGWLPEQRLSVEEALYAYTMGSAYATHEEKVKGTVSVGKEADLTVLSDDIFSIEPEHIKDVHATMTIMGGRITHQTEGIG
jgi:predicted amidohydrolase YtcJ